MNYRRILRLASPALVSLVGTTAVVAPHTFLLDNLTEVTKSFRNGFAVPVSPHVHYLLLETKSDLASNATLQEEHGITIATLNSIKPYTVFGFDMYSLGVHHTEFGARLGVPEYFKHFGEEFSTSGILVNNAQVAWSSPDGQKLRQSLVISENAKKFAIARELLSLHQREVEKNSCIAVGNLVLPFMFAQGISDRLQLKSRPMLLRVVVYGMIATFAAASYVMMKDSFRLSLERRVDSALCSLGDSYREGGLEYYTSLQQRNLALRGLLGDYGPKVYTALGNDKTLIRMKGVPIVERVEFFKKEVAQSKQEVDSKEE